MIDKPHSDKNGNRLHFVEFMQMCADSGYISEPTAREICLFAKYQGGVEAIPAFPGNNPENDDQFTDLLSYIPPGESSFDNYVVTEDNSYAVELARTVALIPRIWKSTSPILFHAGTGQGKTHLLSAIESSSRQNSLFINMNDLKMGYKYCVKTNKESQLLSWITTHNFLLLDDLQFAQGDIEFQHFLCSVFNRMPYGKSAIVLCSNTDIENLTDFDSTFLSRVSSGISIELKSMDLAGRAAVLDGMFRDTGFGPGEEIITYIATEITQNIRTLKAAGRVVLANLLSSPSNSEISLRKVTSLLNSMNLRNPAGIREQTSSSTPQIDDPASPYIVVEIDNEEKSIESEDEKLFKKALEAKRADSESKERKKHEDEMSVSQSQEIPIKEENPSTESASPQPSKPKTEDSSKEQSINMLENATTVSSQIDALKNAASKRIKQLERKNPDSPEIAKLRFAIVFLNEGKIESAMLALK